MVLSSSSEDSTEEVNFQSSQSLPLPRDHSYLDAAEEPAQCAVALTTQRRGLGYQHNYHKMGDDNIVWRMLQVQPLSSVHGLHEWSP